MSRCQGFFARLALLLPFSVISFGANAQAQFGGPVALPPTAPVKVDPPDSKTATDVIALMDESFAIGKIDCKFGELSKVLSTALEGIPVFVDPRGLKMAELSANDTITADLQSMPLRSALRELLEPHSLRAIVENEGLLITADFLSLTRRGIATDRWVHLEPAFAERVEKVFDSPFSAEFIELPLSEAAEAITESSGIPMVIDQRALEEIGLSDDQPVTLKLKDVPLRAVMNTFLADLDLTYMTSNSVITITTIERAEQELQSRIYWLEGIGLVRGDFGSLMDAIQTTIIPDTWEALGGPSTMCPITLGDGNRPAIIISTTYTIHHRIEQLLKSLRESHVGVDPTGTIPAPSPAQAPLNVVGQGGGAF